MAIWGKSSRKKVTPPPSNPPPHKDVHEPRRLFPPEVKLQVVKALESIFQDLQDVTGELIPGSRQGLQCRSVQGFLQVFSGPVDLLEFVCNGLVVSEQWTSVFGQGDK
jgi:hypothetical protein